MGMCYSLYGNTFFMSNLFLRIWLGIMKSTLLINTKETVQGDEESVCMSEQENLEEQAKQEIKNTRKKRKERNMNIKVNSHDQEMNNHLEEKNELRI